MSFFEISPIFGEGEKNVHVLEVRRENSNIKILHDSKMESKATYFY